MNSTPFNLWSVEGKPDPHGDFYKYGAERTAPQYGDTHVARELVSHPGIMALTIAKERLRWLSRQVLHLTKREGYLNVERAQLPMGDLTDDQLANHFYMTETAEACMAGKQRMLWLITKLKELET